MTKRLLSVFLLLLSLSIINGKEILVSNIVELNRAIAEEEPNDVIIMKDGVWVDAVINFNSKATQSGPIILKAQTPGKVILTGASKLIFAVPHLMAEGLYFKDGALTGTNSENADKVVLFDTDHCRLKNSAIENYNPKDFSTYYYWVLFSGSFNRVDDCTFIGKNHLGPVIGNDYSGMPGGKDSRRNRVDHCYFKDIPYNSANDREIFRIWGTGRSEELGSDGAFFTIELNLFENAHGEGSEIISLKSNYNTVEYNTIRGSRGGIVGRSGNFNYIVGNFILGNNVQGTAGIRLAGQGHQVMNNYISNITGDGLMLMAGEFIDSSLTENYKPVLRDGTPLGRVPRYGKVRGAMIANNSFINVGGTDIVLGTGYKSGWPDNQRIILPERCDFINNLIFKTNNGTALKSPAQDVTPPLDVFKFEPNLYQANIIYGGKIELDTIPAGIKIVDPLLQLAEDGLYRPTANSPVVGAGVETFVDDDMDGQFRKFKGDIGADEVSTLPIIRKPISSKNVGAIWMRK